MIWRASLQMNFLLKSVQKVNLNFYSKTINLKMNGMLFQKLQIHRRTVKTQIFIIIRLSINGPITEGKSYCRFIF